MIQPKVTIITVCYNSKKTISATIESVLSQTYENIEYILIDGLSTDGTIDVINNYSDRIDKIICEPDKGIYDAFNKGIKNSTGDYIQIVNSDDTIPNDKIEICVNYMKKNPSVDVLTGPMYLKSQDGKIYERIQGVIPRYKNWFGMFNINHPTFFVKKEVYDNLKFNAYRIGMDFDWTLRALNANYKFAVLEKNLVYMSDQGISNSDYKVSMKEDLTISIKNGVNPILAHGFWLFQLAKKQIFLVLKRFIPLNTLYRFKPGKKFIQ